MLTAELIQEMKRNNVSNNTELTKERVKDAYKSAAREQKNEMAALAGVKKTTFERVYATGSISAKIAVAIAKTLNINPLYLTGDTDERGEGTEKDLLAFMNAKGYKDLAKKAKKATPGKTRVKRVKAEKAETPADLLSEPFDEAAADKPAETCEDACDDACADADANADTCADAVPETCCETPADTECAECADKPAGTCPDACEETPAEACAEVCADACAETPEEPCCAECDAEDDGDGEDEDTMSIPYTEMTEEEASILLHSLFIQAKYSSEARTLLDFIKSCLTLNIQDDADTE